MSAPGFGEIAESLRRATVQVRIDGGKSGSGSGVVWNALGLIVSNAHVVRGDNVEVEFWDGDTLSAGIVRRDARRDLALLEVKRREMPDRVWTDSARLRSGDTVMAVGNPLGFVGALSTGKAHSVGPYPGLDPLPWVQSKILLAPGNSGGALANAEGAVVGINTMVTPQFGLAVPSNDVARFVGGEILPAPPMLGITVETIAMEGGSRPKLGLRIQDVMPGGKAELASLRPGDVIIGIDKKNFKSPADLANRLYQGGLVHLEFLRGGKSVPREVVIPFDADLGKGFSKAA